ncbi:MAG TPA: hypothetical protein VFS39_17415 [Nitrospira sp.]|nr:hypothetical protein [Nitrospira sp.]
MLVVAVLLVLGLVTFALGVLFLVAETWFLQHFDASVRFSDHVTSTVLANACPDGRDDQRGQRWVELVAVGSMIHQRIDAQDQRGEHSAARAALTTYKPRSGSPFPIPPPERTVYRPRP